MTSRVAASAQAGGSKVLMAPASNVLFHVGRCVVLARELAARGHAIHLAGEPRYLTDPMVTGDLDFDLHPLVDFGAEEGMDLLRSIRRLPNRRRIEEMIEAEIALLDALRPDVVIADFRPTLAISARIRSVPLVGLQLGHWTPGFASHPDWTPRSYAITAWARRILGEQASARFAPGIFRSVIRYKTRPFRQAARARAVAAPALVWEYLRGDLNLVTDAEILCPGPLPPDTHRVGPVSWEPEGAAPDWLADLDPNRPVLLVSYGSTAHPDLYRRTLEELSDTDYQVILTTAKQIEFLPEEVPPNFHVTSFVPMQQALAHTDLAIYHGGAGTFHQTLIAGVPGLVVATHWDQEHAGVQTERAGIGRFLTMREVLRSPGLLRRSVAAVLERLGEHRQRIKPLRQALLAHDGPRAAADEIERFLESGQRRSRQG